MTSSTAHNVDLAVIGSGGAAMSAAIHARTKGASVVLVEQGVVGGTCVNVGCIPSKTLLAAGHSRHAAMANPFPGAATQADGVDFAALVAQKDDLAGRLRQVKYVDVAAAYGFEIRPGTASFADPGTLLVGGEPLPAHRYVIATGVEPAVPDLTGLADVDYLTSTTAMDLKQLPDSLLIIGGGPVGMEQAQLFARLGVSVRLVGRLAPHGEPELTSGLLEVFRDDGIEVVEDRVTGIAAGSHGVVAITAHDRRIHGERLLVATGRRPAANHLNLPAAGIRTDDRAFVMTDAQQRTSNPLVLAAGDITGQPQHVYAAAAAGRVAALNALGHNERVDYTGLPAVTFTNPQLASSGLSEAQATAAGHRCICRVLPLSDVPRALVNHDTRGAIKVVADADSHRVLGVHALADAAGEMMLAATYAIKAGFTVEQLADTWAPYLTMAEGLRITAGLFRDELPTSCCA